MVVPPCKARAVAPQNDQQDGENSDDSVKHEARADRAEIVAPGVLGLAPARAPGHVSVYSGPEPPSGGVSRPPFALIAPHCTQFDGVTLTDTVPSPLSSPTS